MRSAGRTTASSKVEINRSGLGGAISRSPPAAGDLRNHDGDRFGQVWLEFAEPSSCTCPELDPVRRQRSYDSVNEPYRWAVGDHHVHRQHGRRRRRPADDGSAVLTLWDGGGADPFAHSGLYLGAAAIIKTYIGDRRIVRAYRGEQQL